MKSFVDASMITQRLCSTRDGQGLLPQLVEKLITDSIPATAIREKRFPHGDQVYLHGADGVLAVDPEVSHLYVPTGFSIWEMGTERPPRSKANQDFEDAEEKLANAFPNIIPAITPDQATFVFVASAPFQDHEKWIKDKRNKSDWKAIRVLDAVALAKWLEKCTAVMLWFAEVFGLPAEGLFDAEQYLKRLAVRFGASLSPEFVIAGREEELTKLRDSIVQSNKTLHVHGESNEEAAAFLAACSLKDAKTFSKKPPLIFADSRANLNLLATFSTEITLVPLNSETLEKAKGLPESRWRLIVPELAGLRTPDGGHGIVLGRCKRSDVEQHLVEQMGISEHKARQMARDSKGSLVALLWLVGSGPIGIPHWADRKDATIHASLMLAGSWIGSNTNDTSIIERLSRNDYRRIETVLQSALIPEGPWIHRNVEWLCASRDFVWAQLVDKITETMLDDFHTVVQEVIGEEDPSLDLPRAERHVANILGKTRKHSRSLRKGLMDSVARLAVVRSDGQSFADQVISELLDPENPEAPNRWLSLVDVYSELAEAAPEVFLNCLDGILRQDSKVFFQDGENMDPFFGATSAHVYLLWALECLAWQREHFPRVLSILAKLAEADPGGKTGNSPINSLVTILLPWSPQHRESMEKAAKALDMLHRVSPSVAWDVATDLLPTSWSATTPTPTPKYRPHGGKHEVTVKEYWEFVRAVVEKMTDWADCNPIRLARLVEAYPELQKGWPEVGDLVTNVLDRTDTNKLTDDDKAIIHEALRKLIAHHGRYEDTEWALPETDLKAMDSIQQKFMPSDLVLQHKHLFSWDPDMPEAPVKPHEDGWDEWLIGKRADAMSTVYDRMDLDGVLRLAAEVVLSATVGQAVATLDLSAEKVAELLQRTLSDDPGQYADNRHMQFGRGYTWAKYQQAGEDWLNRIFEQPGIAWTPELRANLALSILPTPCLWERLKEWGEDAGRLYWRNVEIGSDCHEHWPLILEKWKELGRPWSSIELVSDLVCEGRKDEGGSKPPADLVIDIMETAMQADETVEPYRSRGQMLSYYAEQLFLYLDSLDVDSGRLAKLEWGWLRVLEHTKRGAKALQQQVTSSPELFVELLKALYRADGEQRAETSSADHKNLAEQAFHLLKRIHTIPGLRSADVVKTVDSGALQSWVKEARRLAAEADQRDVCDSQIGQVLSYSPPSPDGTWPCKEVRDLIEQVQSPKIEVGLRIGKYNQRGVVCRGKDGKQEWALAEKYRKLADRIRTRWPRTATILDSLTRGYEEEARQWDEQAKWEEYE